ncbi:hypothetical protein HanPI659440_Chr15g0606081 [Helianthus annuus]|nr:hypothetical protein HanPI659440_Chr15g0606081 [Helianthus annuus]
MELMSWIQMARFQTFRIQTRIKPTFGWKSQNWPNLSDENSILLNHEASIYCFNKVTQYFFLTIKTTQVSLLYYCCEVFHNCLN